MSLHFRRPSALNVCWPMRPALWVKNSCANCTSGCAMRTQQMP